MKAKGLGPGAYPVSSSFDPQATFVDKGGGSAVEMAVSGAATPDRCQAALPLLNGCVRRQAILDEAENAPGFQHAPDLGQRLHGVRDAAERPGCNDAVKAAIFQR